MQMLEWSKIGVSNVAGEISLVCGLLLWVTTYPSIRRKMFELFFYTHHFYIPFIIFFVFHLGISYALFMLPGFYLFLLDRYLRFLQSRQSVQLIYARVLPCETIEINFAKNPGKSRIHILNVYVVLFLLSYWYMHTSMRLKVQPAYFVDKTSIF